tara:strand:- start:43 stop:1701 length:1659 start_codon:yes stop_codon:yes gene_type:complete
MSEDKSDLTRIEDLAEFIHEKDEEVEAAFDEEEAPTTSINDLEETEVIEGEKSKGLSDITPDLSEEGQLLTGEVSESVEDDTNLNSFEQTENDKIVEESETDSEHIYEESGPQDEGALEEASDLQSNDADGEIFSNTDEDISEFSNENDSSETFEENFLEDNIENEEDQEFQEPSNVSESDDEFNGESHDTDSFNSEETYSLHHQMDESTEKANSDDEDTNDSNISEDINEFNPSEDQVYVEENTTQTQEDPDQGELNTSEGDSESSTNEVLDTTTSADTPQAGEEREKKQELNKIKKQNIEAAKINISHQSLTNETLTNLNYNINKFANYAIPKNTRLGGNPPFSVLLKNIKFKNEIKEVLNELETLRLLPQEKTNLFEISLKTGTLLVPQISEHLAISIANKFKHLNLDIEFGLAEEIFQKNTDVNRSRGLPSYYQVFKNNLLNRNIPNYEHVLIVTSSDLSKYDVINNGNIIHISDKLIIDEEEDFSNLKDQLMENLSNHLKKKAYEARFNSVHSIKVKEEKLFEGNIEFLKITLYGIGANIIEKDINI